MTIEERIASALRTQTDLMQPPPLDLAVVRAGAHAQTRRRTAIALSAFALVVASVGVTALTLDGPDQAPQPAKLLPGENGVIVHGGGPGEAPSAELASLPDPSAAPYPAWNAFDQDTGLFLFTTDVERRSQATGEEDARNIRVLAPGRDTPVADINCVQQCNWMASFGPGPEEVTVLVSPSDGSMPRSAQVWGFDGSLHDEIGLDDVVGDGRGIADLEWSPDGSRLAISTFRGDLGAALPRQQRSRVRGPDLALRRGRRGTGRAAHTSRATIGLHRGVGRAESADDDQPGLVPGRSATRPHLDHLLRGSRGPADAGRRRRRDRSDGNAVRVRRRATPATRSATGSPGPQTRRGSR